MQSLAIRPSQKQGDYDADVEMVIMGQGYQRTITVTISHEGKDLRMKGSLDLTLKRPAGFRDL